MEALDGRGKEPFQSQLRCAVHRCNNSCSLSPPSRFPFQAGFDSEGMPTRLQLQSLRWHGYSRHISSHGAHADTRRPKTCRERERERELPKFTRHFMKKKKKLILQPYDQKVNCHDVRQQRQAYTKRSDRDF